MDHTRRQSAGRTLGIVAATALLLAGAILAPDVLQAAPDTPEARAKPLEIAVGGEPLTLEQFLQLVGSTTEMPLYWDPKSRSIQGKQIVGAQNLKAPPDKLFELVRALLTFYDLVIVPVGPEGYKVYLVMEARQSSSILKLKPKYIKLDDDNLADYESQDGLFVTTTIRVENMTNLRDARNALNRIVTQQQIGNVTEVPAARAFVVTDFAPNVVAVYRLLREMDVKPDDRRVTSAYIKLNYATADEIEPIVVDLFTGQQRVTQMNRRPQANQGGTLEEDPEPRIISDFRTNQIIVYGTVADITAIREVVQELDVPVYIQNTWVNVIQLKNLEADVTAEVLQTLIDQSTFFGTSNQSGTSRTPQTPRRPGQTANRSTAGQDQEKPAVVADEASNSLLISATPRQFEELKRIITEIDIRKPQVLIEAALLELTLDDSYRIAVELGMGDDNGLVDSSSASGFGFTTFGMTEFADTDGDTFFTDRIPSFVNDGGAAPTGLVGGIFAGGQIPMIFNILNTVSQSRLLSLPSIVTADNESAVISVLDEQATSQSTTTSGGNVSGGAGDYQPAGVTLQISPHIADDFYLLLNIRLEVSGFQGEGRVIGEALIPADKFSRELITAVTVPDRHTVILGGLLGTTQRSSIDRTPWLADLPYVGYLFQGTTARQRDTNLFLFVTPTIMSEPGGFQVLDQESCKRKQKADELIGKTEIFNSYFPACDYQDPCTGCIRGSGSASDRLDRMGAFEATRFAGVSSDRLRAERSARLQALQGSCAPPPRRAPCPPAPQPTCEDTDDFDTD